MKKSTKIFSTALLLLSGSGLFLPALTPASAHPDTATPTSLSREEKALQQTLSAQEPLASGKIEINQGHVDMGPKFVDGHWRLMFHDDHAETPVWRSPSDVVLRGGDAALLPKPDDNRYSFVNAPAGEKVYVVPQTERSGVVWPGWTTQDPEVVSKLGRGVTLTLDKVEGPGQFTLYLENGNFSAPQVLWNSDTKSPQDIWVDPNSHTHANWVFTKPGIYFLTVTAHADLADGSKVSDTQRLQYAIGNGVSADQIFAQAAQQGTSSASPSTVASTAPSENASSSAAPTSAPATNATSSSPAATAPTTSAPLSSASSSSQQTSASATSSNTGSSLPWILGGVFALILLGGVVLVGVKKRGKSAEEKAKELLK